MKHLFALIISAFFFFSGSLHAQSDNDLQLWENIYLEKNISPKFVAHLNHEGRITDNISRFNYAYLDAGVTWKFKKYLRFSADYVLVDKKTYDMNKTDYRNSLRHQIYVDFVLRKKLGKVALSDRNMLQWEWDDIYSTSMGDVSQLYIRNKISAKYDLGSWSPYVAAEFYFSMIYYDKYGKQFDRGRYYLGVFHAINAVNELEFYGMMERHANVNAPQTNWVIGIGFSHSFYSGGLMGKW